MTRDVIYLEACEIAAERSWLAYDTYCKMDDLNQRSKAIKMARNTTSFDEMVSYYTEDANSVAQKKKAGLLQRAWKALAKAFKALAGKIQGRVEYREEKDIKPEQISPQAKENTKWFAKFKGMVAQLLGKVKAFFSNPRNVAVIGACVTIITFIAIRKKNKKRLKAEAIAKNQAQFEHTKAIQNLIDNTSESSPHGTNDGIAKVRTLLWTTNTLKDAGKLSSDVAEHMNRLADIETSFLIRSDHLNKTKPDDFIIIDDATKKYVEDLGYHTRNVPLFRDTYTLDKFDAIVIIRNTLNEVYGVLQDIQ